MVLLDVQMGKALRFQAQMGFDQIVRWLGVKPMLEMKGQCFLDGQSQSIGHNKVDIRELKREVRWVHLEVRP